MVHDYQVWDETRYKEMKPRCHHMILIYWTRKVHMKMKTHLTFLKPPSVRIAISCNACSQTEFDYAATGVEANKILITQNSCTWVTKCHTDQKMDDVLHSSCIRCKRTLTNETWILDFQQILAINRYFGSSHISLVS